jgi:hypothetical protein
MHKPKSSLVLSEALELTHEQAVALWQLKIPLVFKLRLQNRWYPIPEPITEMKPVQGMCYGLENAYDLPNKKTSSDS